MQIFSSESDNPVDFETDEQQKLDNIKKCMRKTFIPSMIMMIVVFLLNSFMHLNMLISNPIAYLSQYNLLIPQLMFLTTIIYFVNSLLSYLIWCKRSQKSISNGGKCIENTGQISKVIDMIFMYLTSSIVVMFFISMAFEMNLYTLILCVIQVPIAVIVYRLSISIMKKLKVSALNNKIISFIILIVISFGLVLLTTFTIFRSISKPSDEYRTVDWQMNSTDTHEYRIYSDEIPLTCEDLYGETNYENYSYRKRIDSTIFLTKSIYTQHSLPEKNSPKSIEYTILETGFDFIHQIAKKELMSIPVWDTDTDIKAIDNDIFGTMQAFQCYYDGSPTGYYTLIFEDMLIEINLEDPATNNQISVIKKKLSL